VAAAFEAVTGASMRPSYVTLEGDAEDSGDGAAVEKAAHDEEEMLEKLKSEFDAEEVG
jgi:hypothetical protein